MRPDEDFSNSPENSEEELVRRAAAGDRDALQELLARSVPGLQNAFGRAIPSEFQSALDADDLIQITLIEGFVRFGTFAYRGNGSFAAWLRRLTENNLRDGLRELRRVKRVPRHRAVSLHRDSDSYVDLLERIGGSTTTPSGGAAKLEAKELVERGILRLPPDYERVVRLMDLEGLSGPETAISVGRSEGAVYMLRMRAHALLREFLGSGSKFFSDGA